MQIGSQIGRQQKTQYTERVISLRKKRTVVSIVFLGLLLAAGLFIGMQHQENKSRVLESDCVSDPDPVFTHYPTDMTKVVQLMSPLMRVASGVKGHSYIEVTEQVPVYAPADATLVEGVKYREDLGGRGDIDQYTFSFMVSCEVYYFFDHVIDPPAHIAQAFSGPASTDTRSSRIDPVIIKAGDLLGYSAGTGQHNWDFGVVNTTTQTVLADDPQYNHSDKFRHADCPYRYFDTAKKMKLFSLLGYSDAADLKVIDNVCEKYR